jgi:hypothetical protein
MEVAALQETLILVGALLAKIVMVHYAILDRAAKAVIVKYHRVQLLVPAKLVQSPIKHVPPMVIAVVMFAIKQLDRVVVSQLLIVNQVIHVSVMFVQRQLSVQQMVVIVLPVNLVLVAAEVAQQVIVALNQMAFVHSILIVVQMEMIASNVFLLLRRLQRESVRV